MEIEIDCIKPLPVDRWVASSCLQKNIRRGCVKKAEQAALTLWMLDKQSFWNRLGIISMEDVGVASPDAIVETLTACNAPAWRAKHDDIKVGLHLVRRLCEATKIRLCDEIYSIACSSPQYAAYRMALATESNQALADIVLDDTLPLPKRVIGLWLLAGTHQYPADTMPMRKGSVAIAAEVLRSLGAPTDLVTACTASLYKSRYPLALFTTLLWTEVLRQKKSSVVSDSFAKSAVMKGIPLIALDGFTRIGKACFTELQKSLPELKPFTTKQIALSAFYQDGYCINKRLTSDKLEEYRQAGEVADIEAAGLDIPQYLVLRDIMAQHTDTLESIRRKRLQQYLEAAA